AHRQNAAATRVQMFPPKPWGRRPDFMVRLFMADISTKDGSAVKKIHLISTDRCPGAKYLNFLWARFGAGSILSLSVASCSKVPASHAHAERSVSAAPRHRRPRVQPRRGDWNRGMELTNPSRAIVKTTGARRPAPAATCPPVEPTRHSQAQ